MINFFSLLNTISLSGCTTVSLAIHLLKCMWAISSLGQLWIMKSAIKTHVQIFCANISCFFQDVGSYGKHMFNFIRTCWAIFQHGWTIFHSYQDYMKFLVAPHLCQHLVLSKFLNISYFNGHVMVAQCGFSLNFPTK